MELTTPTSEMSGSAVEQRRTTSPTNNQRTPHPNNSTRKTTYMPHPPQKPIDMRVLESSEGAHDPSSQIFINNGKGRGGSGSSGRDRGKGAARGTLGGAGRGARGRKGGKVGGAQADKDTSSPTPSNPHTKLRNSQLHPPPSVPKVQLALIPLSKPPHCIVLSSIGSDDPMVPMRESETDPFVERVTVSLRELEEVEFWG